MADNEPTIVNNGPRKQTIIKNYGNAGGGVYFFAFIGAFVYFMQQATTFGESVIGFFKAIAWPALLVYHAFSFLKI